MWKQLRDAPVEANELMNDYMNSHEGSNRAMNQTNPHHMGISNNLLQFARSFIRQLDLDTNYTPAQMNLVYQRPKLLLM